MNKVEQRLLEATSNAIEYRRIPVWQKILFNVKSASWSGLLVAVLFVIAVSIVALLLMNVQGSPQNISTLLIIAVGAATLELEKVSAFAVTIESILANYLLNNYWYTVVLGHPPAYTGFIVFSALALFVYFCLRRMMVVRDEKRMQVAARSTLMTISHHEMHHPGKPILPHNRGLL